MTYTPGPWTYQQGAYSEGFEIVEIQTTGVGYIAHEADARKMAAAPDMLEALEAVSLVVLYEACCEGCPCCEMREELRARVAAAIAKATGGTP